MVSSAARTRTGLPLYLSLASSLQSKSLNVAFHTAIRRPAALSVTTRGLPSSGPRRIALRARESFLPPSAVATDSITVPGIGEDVSTEEDKGKFVWEKCWYPIAVVRHLDPKIPEPVTILGRPLVIWFDRNSSEWKVFHDMCPHRLAPLSEGRIHESGQLQCSYHGWTFAADGSCGLIPQADKDSSSKVQSSPRACARVYPTKVHQGILWVWPEHSPEAKAESEAAQPATVPELDDAAFVPEIRDEDIGMSDLNYGYEMLVENLLDPSHVPFAHHGLQGDRNKVFPFSMKVKEIKADGVRGEWGLLNGRASFTPPCSIVLEVKLAPPKPSFFSKLFKKADASEGDGSSTAPAPDRRILLLMFCIPRSPGKSRLIYIFINNFVPGFVRKIPVWFTHLTRMKVLDTDHLLLHETEKRLMDEGGGAKAPAVYYSPVSTDAFVTGYRAWLNKFAGSGVKWPSYVDPSLPPSPTKREILDRQAGHVRLCKDCRAAEKNFGRLQAFLSVASFLCLLVVALTPALAAGAASSLPGGALRFGGTFAALAAAFAASAAALSWFIFRSYHFEDFVHAVNE